MPKQKTDIIAYSRRSFVWLRSVLSIVSTLTTFMFVVWLETEA